MHIVALLCLGCMWTCHSTLSLLQNKSYNGSEVDCCQNYFVHGQSMKKLTKHHFLHNSYNTQLYDVTYTSHVSPSHALSLDKGILLQINTFGKQLVYQQLASISCVAAIMNSPLNWILLQRQAYKIQGFSNFGNDNLLVKNKKIYFFSKRARRLARY